MDRCHKLSENVCFVRSERSFSGEKVSRMSTDGRKGEDGARILFTEFTIYEAVSGQASHLKYLRPALLRFCEAGLRICGWPK